ncbi:MAG: trypsin-like peptidase domain-containing protein [Patescibacteria group bacterium]|jgi:S1-C subfamily serine protease
MKNKILIILLVFSLGINAVFFTYSYFFVQDFSAIADDLRLDDQEATVRAINKVKPAVASIIVYDRQIAAAPKTAGDKNDGRVKKGSGTGFLISADGLILTNKHVVSVAGEKTGEYRIILNSGKEYYAQLIGKDPVSDFAVLKIFDKDLPFVELGDSDKLSPGTTVMAIGNALGHYQNSVTKGIISGLGRSVAASEQSTGQAEVLDNVIQTDAEINPGNSGGPLIDLNGKVVGINTAIDQSGASIGFAIPINDAKGVITSVRENGRIIRSQLGVRYIMLTQELAKDKNLPRNSGAWISADKELPAIVPGSAAEKAGLKEGDIIYEVDGVKLENGKTLLGIVQRYKPGRKIGFKVRRGDKILVIIATLEEFK